MKNEKIKIKPRDPSSSEFTIDLRLQEGRTCKFVYSDFSLAEGHYLQLQSSGCVGQYAVRELKRSWKE